MNVLCTCTVKPVNIVVVESTIAESQGSEGLAGNGNIDVD